MGSGSGGATAAPGATMKFSVLTHSQGGWYAPRNIGAIWIEDSSGKFVKTLAVWAATRARYLTKFTKEAGSSRVDAVTSATLNSHKTHDVTWNLKDVSGNPAPQGAYKVVFELTDADVTGKFGSVDFTYDGTPMTLTPPDQQYFTAMQLTL
jgi:hypothetical protein